MSDNSANPSHIEPHSESLLRDELAKLRQHLQREMPGLAGPSAGMTDVVHEAAARVFARQDEVKFESRAGFRAYLWRTARRILIDRWRRRERKSAIEDLGSLASQLPAGPPIEIPDARIDDLLKALGKLPFEDRRVLELAYTHDATVAEIANELGISESAVKMRLSRARDRLADRMRRAGGAS